jgi:hypothetical protein
MYFLKELLPWTDNARVGSPVDKDGRPLTIFGDVEVDVGGLGPTKTRSYRSLAPINLAGKLKIEVGEVITDFSGINTLFLNEDNRWNPEAWSMHVMRLPGTKPSLFAEEISRLTYVTCSEVGLLYNLLRQYCLTTIEGPTYDPESDYYNDGHVAVNYRAAFANDSVESWGIQVDDSAGITQATDDNTSYVGWPGMSDAQATIVSIALGPLHGHNGIPLAASSAALTDKVRLGAIVDIMGKNTYWNNARLLESTIRDLVMKGRLYNQFETALQMVAQTASHIRAPVAEAVALCASAHTLTLPSFTTFRFNTRYVLAGDMGGVRPSAVATYKAWTLSPNSLWVYSALMRSAAEFRGAVTYGTDFDTTGALLTHMDSCGVAGEVGRWLGYAASAMRKEIYVQPDVPMGVSMANYDTAVPFRVVGPLQGYDIIEDVGTGINRRVRLVAHCDERRTGFHSRLLFALNLLPSSKAGSVERSAVIEVQRPYSPDGVCMVKGNQIGPYLTMCRTFGWDATIRIGPDKFVTSWGDNDTRMQWTPYELKHAQDTWYVVTDLKWRGEPLYKQVLHPDITGLYRYEMRIPRVGTLYDYNQPLLRGTFPALVKRTEIGKDAKPVSKREMDVELSLPSFDAALQDFRLVPPPVGQIAPGTADQPPEIPIDPGPQEQQQAD